MPYCTPLWLRIMLCMYLGCILNFVVEAQTDSLANTQFVSATNISGKTINSLSKQYSKLEDNLNKQSEKLLKDMQKKECKLQSKLQSKDSNKAKELFTTDVKDKYLELQGKLAYKTGIIKKFPLTQYVPGLDSMQTALSFLSKSEYLPEAKIKQVQDLRDKLKDLQAQLQKANDIQSFIKEREENLKNQLFNSGLTKQLKRINQKAYYYQARLNEYKEILNDKQKLKEKILETVRTLPAFKKFWQKNSYMASLFPDPSNSSTAATIAGLQKRASVENIIAQRMGATKATSPVAGATSSGGSSVNPQQFMQQQISVGQAQLDQLKDKLNKLGMKGGSSDMTMPDFKPNAQKTKSFLQRLEYGFNIQSQPSHYYLPATTDLALMLGYKLSDSKSVGLGMSYKMGWGNLQNGLKGIHISSDGIGLRSYVDIKSPIKSKGQFLNGLWISGGFEYNYLSSFKSLQELQSNIDVWQKSALLGISKKYNIGKKVGSLQLLYDFLHNQQMPPGTALKFRVGYNL